MDVKTSSTNAKTCTFRALCAHTKNAVNLTIIVHKKGPTEKPLGTLNHYY